MVGVWVVGCVSGSMGGSGEITKNLINLDIIEMGQWVGSGHITKYQINLDLIEIIQLWKFWTFYWTFYLNHLSPLWGYFSVGVSIQNPFNRKY